MDIIYYKANIGNFGDDLNSWLLPRVLGKEIFNNDDESCILGIGSILADKSSLINKASNYKTKYIFGSGVRSINTKLQLDNSFKRLFLRGAYSSYKLTKNLDDYISDGAYALGLTTFYDNIRSAPKKNT